MQWLSCVQIYQKCQIGDQNMLWKKSKKSDLSSDFDKTGKKPVIRSSICTGEKVAGFKDEKTGHVEELVLIRNEKDLEQFMRMYGVLENEIEKIW